MNNENTLYYLETILFTKNISKAADMLYISQPYLSKFLKTIEQELQTEILNRKTFTLTENGKLFLDYLKRVENEKEFLVKEISKKTNTQKVINIGILSTLSTYLFPLFLPALLQKYNNVKIEIVTDFLSNNEKRLLNGEIDFLIGQDYETLSPNCMIHHCGAEKYFAIIPKSSAFFQKGATYLPAGKVALEELLQEELILTKKGSSIRRKLDFILEKNAITPKIHFECDNIFTVLQLAKSGLGTTFIPQSVLNLPENRFEDYNALPLSPDFLNINFFIAYQKGRSIDEPEQALIDLFMNSLENR